MPWQQTDPMFERSKFIAAHQSGLYAMSELCRQYGISRKAGYKWTQRFQEEGSSGLADRSRAPSSCPHKLDGDTAQRIIETRRSHPDWGPRKIIAYLEARYPEHPFPAPSTAGDLLRREGLVPPRRLQRRAKHPGAPALQAAAPNDVWTADFKGEFLLGNRRYCYPLTVCDGFSRYILSCMGLPSTAQASAERVFRRLFHEYGLPGAIRTDNGVPFATRALWGLSRLNVYWMKLGIRHERIERGKPQQNGRHERMHRTLKAATTRPPSATMAAQQQCFDDFVATFNHDRPHEALSQKTPASFYTRSTRAMPSRMPAPEYPGHFFVRLVSEGGTFKFNSEAIFITHVLVGERIGLEETDDGIWSIHFYDTLLGKLDERTGSLIT